jgi:hypothetical protein
LYRDDTVASDRAQALLRESGREFREIYEDSPERTLPAMEVSPMLIIYGLPSIAQYLSRL